LEVTAEAIWKNADEVSLARKKRLNCVEIEEQTQGDYTLYTRRALIESSGLIDAEKRSQAASQV